MLVAGPVRIAWSRSRTRCTRLRCTSFAFTSKACKFNSLLERHGPSTALAELSKNRNHPQPGPLLWRTELSWTEDRAINANGETLLKLAEPNAESVQVQVSAHLECNRFQLATIKKAVPVDARLRARKAFALAKHGCALIYKYSDYEQGKQLLINLRGQARKQKKKQQAREPFVEYQRERSKQAAANQVEEMLLVHFGPGYHLDLPRAPKADDLANACEQALGIPRQTVGPFLLPLKTLLGIVGAYQLRLKGVHIDQLDGALIRPFYGVFPPVRKDHFELLARSKAAKWGPQECDYAYDIGVGSGVLSAILLHQNRAKRVIGTDVSPRAIACANANLESLDFKHRFHAECRSLFPVKAPKAGIIVCNPPWLPAKPRTLTDIAVYDTGGSMLRHFLQGAATHLEPDGTIYLIMSNIAELLHMRKPGHLEAMFHSSKLHLMETLTARPTHQKVKREKESLIATAKEKELISLYILKAKPPAET